jgi:alkylation response protein AidB-like acyl-CoA dehydrogenase
VLEEINAVCASTGVTISVHNSLVNSPLGKWCTEAQKRAGSRSSPRASGSAPTA